MTIHIESLQIDTIIGLLDFERDREQRISVDLKASYNYNVYNDDTFINYADVASMIEDRIKTKQYLLLEEALLDLQEQITKTYPNIDTLYLKISKPDILPNCTVALSHTWEIEP